MNTPLSESDTSHLDRDVKDAATKWRRLLPAAIVAASILLAAVVLYQEFESMAELNGARFGENQLRMQARLSLAEEYFDSVYSTLLFVSLDENVKAMRKDSHDYIQKLYEHQWNNHRLTEIYVVEKEFTGKKRPFMTFERESEDHKVEEVHALERDEEEYETDIKLLRLYETNTALQAMISGELHLCAPDEHGDKARGFVYSVPIRVGTNNDLAGLVAGMIETKTIIEHLNLGSLHRFSLLINESGQVIVGTNSAPDALKWVHETFAITNIAGFFENAPDQFDIHEWKTLWSPAKIISGEKWWLLMLYDDGEESNRSKAIGLPAHFVLAGSIVFAGCTLGFLLKTLNKRLQEQERHLWERKKLERQIHEVTEREQRRVGESLQEDLCQRLAGLEAVSKLLAKKLIRAESEESTVATEIANELNATLIEARVLADELQPVSLLEHGFLAAIKKLADTTEGHHRIDCRVQATELPPHLEANYSNQLYRITKEAVRNAVQHSGGTEIKIEIVTNVNLLTVEVHDNGKGIVNDQVDGDCFGIRMMRYRSELIGAKLEIEKRLGGGTTVRCLCRVMVASIASGLENPKDNLL